MFKKAIMITLSAAVAFVSAACSNGGDSSESDISNNSDSALTSETEATTVTEKIYVTVTDGNGKAVTDSNGEAVTSVQDVVISQIPETTYVTVTDSKGEAVTDSEGYAVTSAQTVWVTTKQTVTAASSSPQTTTVSKATTQAKTTTTQVKTTTTAKVTTATAQQAQSGDPTYAYGALSTVDVDMIEATGDGDFINLVFNVKDGASGTYSVDIYELSIANKNLEIFEYTQANGCVSVGKGVQTDVPSGGDPTIYIESVEGTPGEKIVVPVKVKNNAGICSFDFKVRYDSNGLELISIDKGSLIAGTSWMWVVNTEFIPR